MKIGSLQICKLHVHADFMGERSYKFNVLNWSQLEIMAVY